MRVKGANAMSLQPDNARLVPGIGLPGHLGIDFHLVTIDERGNLCPIGEPKLSDRNRVLADVLPQLYSRRHAHKLPIHEDIGAGRLRLEAE